MEAIKNFFENLTQGGEGFLGKMNKSQKIMLGGGIVAVIVAVVSVFAFQNRADFEYVFDNLSAEDSQSIVSYLKKSGLTEYIVDGRGVKVPSKDVMSYRIRLAQEGLPSQGIIGWEQFDKSDFSRTEFERKINKIRAIQGELSRTINNIEGVKSSRVHIVMPQKRLFDKDQKEATAAIQISMKNASDLSNKQIKGILHIVSRSVEGLSRDSISIVDDRGRLLTEERSSDPDDEHNKTMLSYKRSVERRLEEKVRTIVGRVVGQQRVEAKVDVDIDFTKEEQTISDLDPNKVVVISQNTVNQLTEGNGLNPTGIPGAKSNVPGEQEALNLSTSKSKNSRDQELVNYEIAKTISRRILPMGNIKRISAAVIVDGKQVYPMDGTTPDFEPRTEDEMMKIGELVRSALGFIDGRDEVKVHNLLFQLDNVQAQKMQAEETEKREYVSTITISALTALGLILFFAFVVRPYFRWLFYNPDRKKAQEIVEEFLPDFESEGRQSVQVKEDIPFEKLSVQEKVNHIAKHEPVRTTEAIRIILNPHQ